MTDKKKREPGERIILPRGKGESYEGEIDDAALRMVEVGFGGNVTYPKDAPAPKEK